MALKPRAFETLLYLVEHPGVLVEKSTLMAELWPGTVVEENNLNKQVSELRRALGKDECISTVPGRGYQFIAPVKIHRDDAPATSIAVLPFTNLTGDPEMAYLGDGLAEELIHTIAQLPRLKVAARTSSFAYRDRTLEAREIARELGVAVVLEASVRQAGDRIRVTVQLVDGHSGFHIWSQTFERPLTDLFDLQDTLARAIVQALRITLDGSLPPIRNVPLPPTRDLDAYRFYLQAMVSLAQSTPQTLEHARELLRQAVELDPGFGHAHAGLAVAELTGVFLNLTGFERLAVGEQAAERALELDSRLAIAHAMRGVAFSLRGRFVDARACFEEARVIDTQDARIILYELIYVHEIVGHVRLALEQSGEVVRLAPAWLPGIIHRGVVASIAGTDEIVRQQCERALELGWPKARPPMPHLLKWIAGRSVESATGSESGPEHQIWIHQVMGHVRLGDLDRAFECANAAVDHAQQWNAVGVHWAHLWAADMKPFRHDTRFEALVRRLGLTGYWDLYGRPDRD
jgi:TolB-like protein